MSVLIVFFIGFFFSFIGSIPPGSINMIAIQLGIENKFKTAVYFSLAASVMEYPYAWIAVGFGEFITSNPDVAMHLKWIGAVVMLVLGFITLRDVKKANQSATINTANYGFTKGLLLAILNPMAMPYWLGVTTGLKTSGMLQLPDQLSVHAYLIGIVVGTFTLLVLAARLSAWLGSKLHRNKFIQFIPGVVLIVLGIYSLVLYILQS
ncbi:MAG: LysE family transporter [Cyclobacteriaceae bacterium]|jgi:threonine/homoserine/homoserine lactone efflux protein|nr:LysE family translocator [Flammeovirgaceae bacterium]MCZ8021084.1 LysE family transporter [Cytophagales bacterium]MCZ8328567.1 LysE family transporter [Cyclobacteriaceae bacterium]